MALPKDGRVLRERFSETQQRAREESYAQMQAVTLSKKAKSETSRSESELVKAGRSVSVRVDPSQQ